MKKDRVRNQKVRTDADTFLNCFQCAVRARNGNKRATTDFQEHARLWKCGLQRIEKLLGVSRIEVENARNDSGKRLQSQEAIFGFRTDLLFVCGVLSFA